MQLAIACVINEQSSKFSGALFIKNAAIIFIKSYYCLDTTLQKCHVLYILFFS